MSVKACSSASMTPFPSFRKAETACMVRLGLAGLALYCADGCLGISRAKGCLGISRAKGKMRNLEGASQSDPRSDTGLSTVGLLLNADSRAFRTKWLVQANSLLLVISHTDRNHTVRAST